MNEVQDISRDETFLTYLQKEFELRKSKNSSYSIRAFARLLDVDQSLLSKFFRGKAELHWKSIDQCLDRLNAPEKVKAHFQEKKFTFTSEYQNLEEEMLNAMGCWRYWAILEYFKINPVAGNQEIARRFMMEEAEVESIVNFLKKSEFIRFEDGKYVLLKPNNFWANSKKTSDSRKKLQKSIINESLKSIDTVSIDSRYHCSMTIAVDKERMEEFKERMNNILIDLGKFMQKNDSANEVYQLTLGFFPLTVQEEK